MPESCCNVTELVPQWQMYKQATGTENFKKLSNNPQNSGKILSGGVNG